LAILRARFFHDSRSTSRSATSPNGARPTRSLYPRRASCHRGPYGTGLGIIWHHPIEFDSPSIAGDGQVEELFDGARNCPRLWANSCARAYLPSGDGARQRWTISTSAGGMWHKVVRSSQPGRNLRPSSSRAASGAGRVACGVSGRIPSNSSTRVSPRAYTSAAGPTSDQHCGSRKARSCSGAM
jgi:hypothetical protein